MPLLLQENYTHRLREMLKQGELDAAILALPAVVLIGGAVTRALMEISLTTGIPCVHEVLTVQTEKQALQRCVDPRTNRGVEAAHAALEISEALASIASPGSRRQTG